MFENVIEWMRARQYHEACYKLRGMQGCLYNGVCHGAIELVTTPGVLPEACDGCPHWRLGGSTEHQSPQCAAPAEPSIVCIDTPDDLSAADAAKVVYGKPRTETRKVRLTEYSEEMGARAKDGAALYRKEMTYVDVQYEYCPACGASLSSHWDNYCRKCGAKMDRGDGDE